MKPRKALQYYIGILDYLGDNWIAQVDFAEAQPDRDDYLDDSSFSALDRIDQASIMRELDRLERTKNVNRRTGTSYLLKHALEMILGRYVSNQQCRVAMRLLKFKQSSGDFPVYNITKRSADEFCDIARSRNARTSVDNMLNT